MADHMDNTPHYCSYNHPKRLVYPKQEQEHRRQDDARVDEGVELASIPALFSTALCT
jgi:hypothetical protein